jgi:MoaA/NifB/PqqE/SkfB family radical SAM enzyme
MKSEISAIILENKNLKSFKSEDYNFNFDKKTGYFERWGKKKEDDPQFSPFGPEILDIEVTTKCIGPGGKLCPFCYKANTPNGTNMSFETFKTILDKMPRTLTQVAFGADAQATSNTDLFKMMEYCRYKEVVPNITVADITDNIADILVSLTGAVAVSRYVNKDICYNSVKKLTDRGLKQTNIHIMISQETYEQAIETIKDYKTDTRLANLNAIVFLSLKKKGRGEGYMPLTQEQFKSLVDLAFNLKVPFGFDSCSCNKFLKSIKDRPDYKQISQSAEPCESSAFSSYIDVFGKFHPCSFTGEDTSFGEGLDVVNSKDFVKDIWNNPKTVAFRNNLIKCGRSCPIYKV